jgi:hypothetical protein
MLRSNNGPRSFKEAYLHFSMTNCCAGSLETCKLVLIAGAFPSSGGRKLPQKIIFVRRFRLPSTGEKWVVSFKAERARQGQAQRDHQERNKCLVAGRFGRPKRPTCKRVDNHCLDLWRANFPVTNFICTGQCPLLESHRGDLMLSPDC